MKTGIGIFLAIGLLLEPFAASAAPASVVLSVHNASCALCGPIVRSALTQVAGVTRVSVGPADGAGDVTAVVDYDDALTAPAAMIRATTEHGYPAEIATAAKS
jgi:mercuric ion binding protein